MRTLTTADLIKQLRDPWVDTVSIAQSADRLEAIVKAWKRVPMNPTPAAFEALRAAILGDDQ